MAKHCVGRKTYISNEKLLAVGRMLSYVLVLNGIQRHHKRKVNLPPTTCSFELLWQSSWVFCHVNFLLLLLLNTKLVELIFYTYCTLNFECIRMNIWNNIPMDWMQSCYDRPEMHFHWKIGTITARILSGNWLCKFEVNSEKPYQYIH